MGADALGDAGLTGEVLGEPGAVPGNRPNGIFSRYRSFKPKAHPSPMCAVLG